MNFWDNLLRYPRFFISSMIGLFLVLLTPIIRVSKEIPNKKLLFLFFLSLVISLLWVLNQMINPDY
jgi:Protein of unknown function (DUF751)